jgi:hypothetical protein
MQLAQFIQIDFTEIHNHKVDFTINARSKGKMSFHSPTNTCDFDSSIINKLLDDFCVSEGNCHIEKKKSTEFRLAWLDGKSIH